MWASVKKSNAIILQALASWRYIRASMHAALSTLLSFFGEWRSLLQSCGLAFVALFSSTARM